MFQLLGLFQLRTEMFHLRTEMFQLRTEMFQLRTECSNCVTGCLYAWLHARISYFQWFCEFNCVCRVHCQQHVFRGTYFTQPSPKRTCVAWRCLFAFNKKLRTLTYPELFVFKLEFCFDDITRIRSFGWHLDMKLLLKIILSTTNS